MDLKAMIEDRMKTTQADHQRVTALITQTERQLTQLTTQRVELASIYNADKILLEKYESAKEIPDEEPEIKVKKVK